MNNRENLMIPGYRNSLQVKSGIPNLVGLQNNPILGSNFLKEFKNNPIPSSGLARPMLSALESACQRPSSYMVEPCITIDTLRNNNGARFNNTPDKSYNSALIGQKTPIKNGSMEKLIYSYNRFQHPKIKNFSPLVNTNYYGSMSLKKAMA